MQRAKKIKSLKTALSILLTTAAVVSLFGMGLASADTDPCSGATGTQLQSCRDAHILCANGSYILSTQACPSGNVTTPVAVICSGAPADKVQSCRDAYQQCSTGGYVLKTDKCPTSSSQVVNPVAQPCAGAPADKMDSCQSAFQQCDGGGYVPVDDKCPTPATPDSPTNQTTCAANGSSDTTDKCCTPGVDPQCGVDQSTCTTDNPCKDIQAITCESGTDHDSPGVNCQGTTNGACTKDSCDLIAKYLDGTINLLSLMVGLAVTITIISSGIQYSASGGDPQKAAIAKSHMAKAVIALVAYGFLYGFLQFIIPGGLFK